MRLVIALFVLALLATVASSIGLSVWGGRAGQSNTALRTIHYDTHYDLSSQRRMPVDESSR